MDEVATLMSMELSGTDIYKMEMVHVPRNESFKTLSVVITVFSTFV